MYLEEANMAIQNDGMKLKAALEVIMDKIVKANDVAKFDETQPDTFLELLAKELYRLVRVFEKHLWCNALASEAASVVDKIKTLQTSQDYEEVKRLIDEAYAYSKNTDTLWAEINGFVHDVKDWVFQIWHTKKPAPAA